MLRKVLLLSAQNKNKNIMESLQSIENKFFNFYFKIKKNNIENQLNNQKTQKINTLDLWEQFFFKKLKFKELIDTENEHFIKNSQKIEKIILNSSFRTEIDKYFKNDNHNNSNDL